MKDLKKLDQKAVEAKYGRRFNELGKIIEKHDPMGFMAFEGMKGEYDLEVKTIIVQLEKDMSVEEVHNLVFQEFVRWFEEAAGEKEAYKELAKEVWEWNRSKVV